MGRRLVDGFVMLVLGVTVVAGGREAFEAFRQPELTVWPVVVAIGQLVAAAGGLWAIVSLWRDPRRAPGASLVWAAGGLVAGSVATFAWSPFDRTAFLGAVAGMILIESALYWWLRRRLRPPRERAAASSS